MDSGRNLPEISEFNLLGDSLSDRGMLWNRKLFGIFPMADWSGLKGNSPDKRFTNGPVWADDFVLLLFMEFKLREILDPGSKGKHLFNKLSNFYQRYLENPALLDVDADLVKFYKAHMEDPEFVGWKGHALIRSYSEGGVADDPSIFSLFTAHGQAFLARLAVRRLKSMRELLIEEDKENDKQQNEKIKSLVMEWTGANDLVTINDKPTKEAAELAVHERIKNVKKLIQYGYQNFLLFDLPDLSLTPRFCKEKNPNDPERTANAHNISVYFNELLQAEVGKLAKQYPQCNIEVFEVSKRFEKIYKDPEKYRLDPNEITNPLKSDNYQTPKPGEVLVSSKDVCFLMTCIHRLKCITC